MTADLEIDVTAGRIRGIPVPVTAVDTTVINGPCAFVGWSLRDASGDVSSSVEGSVTSPGALATIAQTAVLPAGTYEISWDVSLAGTLAAGDANNMQIRSSAGVILVGVFPGVAGTYPQAPVQVTLTSPSAITVQSIAAGTVGAIYSAQISAQFTVAPNAVVEFQDGNQPLGESSMQTNTSDTEFLPGGGIRVGQMIRVHLVQGAVTGVIYARYDQQSI